MTRGNGLEEQREDSAQARGGKKEVYLRMTDRSPPVRQRPANESRVGIPPAPFTSRRDVITVVRLDFGVTVMMRNTFVSPALYRPSYWLAARAEQRGGE